MWEQKPDGESLIAKRIGFEAKAIIISQIFNKNCDFVGFSLSLSTKFFPAHGHHSPLLCVTNLMLIRTPTLLQNFPYARE